MRISDWSSDVCSSDLAIIGFSEILKAEALGPLGNPRYAEYATDIHDSGSHLLSLINDVLDFSKAEAGRLDLREEPLDLRDIVSDCLRLVAPGAKRSEERRVGQGCVGTCRSRW